MLPTSEMAAQMRPWKMIFIRHTLVLSCIVTAGLLLEALAQETPCLRRTVMASVLTTAGQPVASVPASSFRGTFRGKPVRVLSATRDLGPRRIVVLLDASGSMGQPPGKWELARGAVREIVLTSPAEYQIAFLIFTEKVDRVVGFPEGRKAAADGLAALEPGRGWIPKGKT